MKTILMTGVTGQVGSYLARELKGMGYKILYLVRASGKEIARDRLKKAIRQLTEFDIPLVGDVTLSNVGISNKDLAEWEGKIDMILHGAASIKFDAGSAEENLRVNVGGTANMLALADRLGVKNFHHLSTAYIAGDATKFADSDFSVGQTARNPYESSKFKAEELIRKWKGGRFSIYRLSIVVGDSISGEVNAFNGYYGFLVPFWRLLRVIKNKIESDPGYKESGVCFSNDGFLELPLTVGCSLTSTLNLVTGDWVSKILAKLTKIPCNDQTYNIVNPDPPKVQWAIKESLRCLGIRGLSYGENQEQPKGKPLKQLQSMITRGLKVFLPYVTRETMFCGDNLQRALKGDYVTPPVIDDALIARMVAYAKSVNFGDQ